MNPSTAYNPETSVAVSVIGVSRRGQTISQNFTKHVVYNFIIIKLTRPPKFASSPYDNSLSWAKFQGVVILEIWLRRLIIISDKPAYFAQCFDEICMSSSFRLSRFETLVIPSFKMYTYRNSRDILFR